MARILASLILAILITGCAEQWALTETIAQPQETRKAPANLAVRVEGCVNRTDSAGTRDLAGEATQALMSRLRESHDIEVRDNAPLLLTCDVERFEEGSAFQRWLWPGLGSAIGGVAVTVWDAASQRVMLTLRSQSSVRSGGFYTVGAGKAIFRAVFDDLVKKLEKWSRGKEVDGGRQEPAP